MKYKVTFIFFICAAFAVFGAYKYFPGILNNLNNLTKENLLSVDHRGNKVSDSEINQINQKQTKVNEGNIPETAVSDKETLIQLIVKNISEAKDTVVSIKDDSLKKNINQIAQSAAEDFGYSGYLSDISYGISEDIVYIHFDYRGGADYFIRCINEVNSRVRNITAKIITPGMSDFDKELAVHNYVVNNVTYDYKNLQNNTLAVDDYTAYGALINGSAVCQGYAEAVYRLLNAANINNCIVFGTGNNIKHSWNIAVLKGNYFHVDATFDDPVSNLGPVLSYGYFNISDTQIAMDHTWDTSKYPKCTSDSENYYVVNHLIAKDRSSFYNIIRNGLSRKESVIRCKTSGYNENIFNSQVVLDVIRDNKINYLNLNKQLGIDYNSNTCEMQIYVPYK